MSYLIVLVVDNIDQCPDIFEAWEKAGALGVTILESSGLGRVRRAGLRDDIPLMPNLSDLLQRMEVHHRTLFAVVDERQVVDRMIDSANRVIGDLDKPHTGFLFVVPVIEAYGLGKHRSDRSAE